MTFKVEVSKEFQGLLDSTNKKGLIADVRKNFSRKGHTKIKQAIIQDMIKGISPVKGAGKFQKYSPSYKKEISNNKSRRMQSAKPTKQKSPVNLRLKGKLHKDLHSFFVGNALVIQFRNFLADIHNRQGAGKSKVIRRMLPTNKGESFNRRIETVIFDELKKAVDKVAKQFSRQ